MKLSVVIPVHNEADGIEETVLNLFVRLKRADIAFEILVVDDHSSDETPLILERLKTEIPGVRFVKNPSQKGFGLAVRTGLKAFKGDAVAIVMGDGSDSPEDVVRFFRKLEDGYDAVFGSRFITGGIVEDYPFHKLVLNRVVNQFIRVLFQIRYNDTTNAFKMYRRRTVEGLRPFLSHHFNLTVELPLKAITRGYSYAVLPNSWKNRRSGESKLRLKEMGSRYLFIILYCLIEKWLSVGDYKKETF
ncbi:MAG: glycosyltransferase family 2 protein [Deltaproteobacteria bacterium]|nr:glycosyltransferase family 2 protein [Deltaproteobacteria bacterium]